MRRIVKALAALVVASAALSAFAGRVTPGPEGPGLQVSVSRAVDRPDVGRVLQDPAQPALPRASVDTTEPHQSGRTINVADGSLQAALDRAQPGDTLVLEAGRTYEGPFELPAKQGDGWIVITTSARSQLPAAGHRVDQSQTRLMPKLIASGDYVVATQAGAHHYRFVGIEIAPTSGHFVYALAQLGNKEASADRLPHHIIIDRCYLHGDAGKGTRRGVAMNGRDMAVVDSYLADFKEAGADSQAIAGWNGPGPFKIFNNYLEAAGENVMFGGADPEIQDLVPADIEIARNFMTKPLKWRSGEPGYDQSDWTIKNLFELKNARRVLVDGNIFEHNWAQAQNGFAILFTVRNQKGTAPWSTVEDVTFTNNVVRHVGAGVNILGRDDNNQSRQTRRIAIRNNMFSDVSSRWGGNGRLFQLLDGTSGVIIDHNTASQSGGIVFGGDHDPHDGFVFQNNVMPDNNAGFVGSGSGAGKPALERYFPGATIRKNVLIGGKPSDYPADNFFPSSIAELKRYAGAATDGRDPGVDSRRLPSY